MTAHTYRVVDAASGGFLTHVKVAPDERASDSFEERNAKRLWEAERLRSLWSHNYYNHERTLTIVTCDRRGEPLIKVEPRTPAEREPVRQPLPKPRLLAEDATPQPLTQDFPSEVRFRQRGAGEQVDS